MTDINSRDYWNARFRTDWSARRGNEQSRFFTHIALELMPDWLRRGLGDGITICDWGCAMGDGTAELARALPGARVTGIDFSAAAIEQARACYPEVTFACRDLLQDGSDESFDVVFTSNVLEHFHRPDEVLAQLAHRARRLMVHLLPFREPVATREPEHHVSFDWRDLRLVAAPGWMLVHAAVADTTRRADGLWLGEQILLVHARIEHLAALGLSLAELRIDSPSPRRLAASELEAVAAAVASQVTALLERQRGEADAALRELRTRVDALAADRAQQEARARDLARDVSATRDEITRLANDLQQARQESAAARSRLDSMRASRSWRWTAPLRALFGARRDDNG